MVRLNYQARQIFFWRKKFHYFLNPRETTFFVYNRTHSWRYVLPSGVVKIDDISFRAGSSRFGSCASLFGFRNSCTYKVSIRGGGNFYLLHAGRLVFLWVGVVYKGACHPLARSRLVASRHMPK